MARLSRRDVILQAVWVAGGCIGVVFVLRARATGSSVLLPVLLLALFCLAIFALMGLPERGERERRARWRYRHYLPRDFDDPSKKN